METISNNFVNNRTPEEKEVFMRGLICGDGKSNINIARGDFKQLLILLNENK